MARPVPAVPQVNKDDPITAADWNAFVYAAGFHIHPTAALLFQTLTQTIASGTGTRVGFDSAERDSDAAHDPTSNNTRFTAPVPGLYQVTADAGIAGNSAAGAERSMGLIVNGTTLWSAHLLVPQSYDVGSFYASCTADIPLNMGDYVEVSVYQDSGGNDTTWSGQSLCRLFACWVAQ